MKEHNAPSKRRYALRHIATAIGIFAAFAAVAGTLLRPAAPAVPGPPVHATSVQLVRVIDGDTIVVRTSDGGEETVRYIGMDTPEYDGRTGTGQDLGLEAREANDGLLRNRALSLALDREHRDRFGRLLAYVYAGDEFVNATLVQQGLARVLVIPPNDKHLDLLLRLQAEALKEERGLWGIARANPVPWQEAAQHIDRAAVVEGVVTRTHKDPASGITFLNFSANIREDFVVIVSEPYAERFPKPVESNYSGHRVRVAGLVESFQGQPQIAVQIPEQIEVLD